MDFKHNIETNIPLLEEILGSWKSVIGTEYEGYRNHVYRMYYYCLLLSDTDGESKQKLQIAAAFHDMGIWIDNTVDYIPPSIPPAMNYLETIGLEGWAEEISLMISEHHKLTRFTDSQYPLVEIFRKDDLVDFSFGLFRFGIPFAKLREVMDTFPNAGFHKNLARRAGRWFTKNPLNPLPMMKW